MHFSYSFLKNKFFKKFCKLIPDPDFFLKWNIGQKETLQPYLVVVHYYSSFFLSNEYFGMTQVDCIFVDIIANSNCIFLHLFHFHDLINSYEI